MPSVLSRVCPLQGMYNSRLSYQILCRHGRPQLGEVTENTHITTNIYRERGREIERERETGRETDRKRERESARASERVRTRERQSGSVKHRGEAPDHWRPW